MDSQTTEALNTLYNATRQLSVPAEAHDKLRQMYDIVYKALDTGANVLSPEEMAEEAKKISSS